LFSSFDCFNLLRRLRQREIVRARDAFAPAFRFPFAPGAAGARLGLRLQPRSISIVIPPLRQQNSRFDDAIDEAVFLVNALTNNRLKRVGTAFALRQLSS
jgi:hypothetical protein